MSLAGNPGHGGQLIGPAGRKLQAKWGGRLPTWHEFQGAVSRGSVQVNVNLAGKAMGMPGIPRMALFYYNCVVVYGALALLIAPVAAWWFAGLSGWWILPGFIVAAYLGRYAKWGRARTVLSAAVEQPALYVSLIGTGIFDFAPEGHAQ